MQSSSTPAASSLLPTKARVSTSKTVASFNNSLPKTSNASYTKELTSIASKKISPQNHYTRDLNTELEIEEISKKISEHADALYRTWKSQGMVPNNEILNFYSVESANSVGASAEVLNSTEGLQKFVQTFVSKDKEKRGVREAKPNKMTKANGSDENMKGNHSPVNSSAGVGQQKLQQSQRKTSIPTIKPLISSGQNENGVRKSLSGTKNMIGSKLKLNTNLKNGNSGIQNTSNSNLANNNAATNTITSSDNGNKLNFDIDLDLKVDLALNVHQLSEMQTQNLQKIQQLLQESQVKIVGATKIPTFISSNLLGNGKKTIKAAAPKRDDITDSKLTKQNAPDATSLSQRQQRSINIQQDSAIKKAATTVTENANVFTEKADNESVEEQISNISFTEGQNDKVLRSEDKQIADKTVAIIKPEQFALTTTNHNKDVVQKLCGNEAESKNITKTAKIVNKRADGKMKTKSKQVSSDSKMSSIEGESNASHQPLAAEIIPEEEISSKLSSNHVKDSRDANQNLPIDQDVPNEAKAETRPNRTLNGKSSKSNANNGSTMPTPTKFKSTRVAQNNGQEKTPRSPFLTRGSVAERVLMFEKCPEARHAFLNIKRPEEPLPKIPTKVKLHATPPPPPSDQNSLQKEIRTLKSVYIPRFYFPHGKPQPTIAVERTLRGILSAFDTFPNNQVTKDELPQIIKICGLPHYWRMPVMVFCQQANSGLVERQRFVDFWKQMNVYCHDNASRFVYILSRGQRYRNYVVPDDFIPLVQDVVDTHPGLTFLKEATEFHSRYVHTVIARIFYSVNRSWSGKISISELKRSDLLEVISMLEEEDDINQIMAFFSYEHFYVIYCKFWELDKDHDLLISQNDLARHSDHALSTRIIERIFSGCVTRTDKKNIGEEPKMSYTDFVWFLLSEEDKRTPTAIEYWFRCMDTDGDGVLSIYELEYFYEEQQQRLDAIGIESLPFEDCLCQMLDMIKPQRRDAITLSDLKRCKMTHIFFDTFFNLEKYLDHEQRDPFATLRDEYTSDWDRFAAQEYELLITEEND